MHIEKVVSEALEHVIDKRLDLSAVQMGLQPELLVENNSINLKLTAGFPCQLLAVSLLPRLKKQLQQDLSAYQIQIQLHQVIKSHRTQLVGKSLRGVKNTLAIASGKGGVGKSTVAVNLAVALARAGAKVGILDADIYGPSIPLMLGKTQAVELDGEHYLPVHAHGIYAMSIGYLTNEEQALIWRGPMLAKALIQMLDITLWPDLDYLIIDLPPGTGDIQLSLVQKIPLTAAMVVTTPQAVATLDAKKAIAMFHRTGIHVLGLIENMSLHLCSHCGHQDAIFGSGGGQNLSEKLQTPLLGQLPLDGQIRHFCDAGKPVALDTDDALAQPFIKIALQAAMILAKQPLNYADKLPNIVVE